MGRFQYTDINEPVKVGAVFENARVRPRWFIWKKRKYNLKKITYDWVEKDGEKKYLCFSVWDGENLYEISFDLKFMSWRLNKVYLE
ncbi:hypothetical protein ACFLUV_02310 [Elusimicrobiota bacterium]